MVPKPAAIELSDELLALCHRAAHASADARRLLDENERWRQSVLEQLEYVFELSADFRRARRPTPVQRRSGVSFQVGHAFLDQGSMALPFDQGLLQELDEPLRLFGIMTSGLQVRKQVLLAAQTFPPVLDIAFGLEQKRLLRLELLDRIRRKGCHAAT
jgi:hypothetical protein